MPGDQTDPDLPTARDASQEALNMSVPINDTLANIYLVDFLAEGMYGYATDGCKPGELTGSGTGCPCFYSQGVWISFLSQVGVTT